MGLKRRILNISVIPLLALALLSGFILIQSVNNLRNSQDVQETARIATAVGQLVHELQAERGLSVLAIAEGRVGEKLQTQRLKVDSAARGVETGARNLPEGISISGVRDGTLEIARLRQAVDTRTLPRPELMSAYTAVVRRALDDLDAMARLAGAVDPELDQTFEVYSAVLIGKELSGRERATMSGLLAAGGVSPAGLGAVAALQAGQVDAFRSVTVNAAPASLERWAAFIASQANQNLEGLRDTLSQGTGGPPPITASDWFDASSARMDGLRDYELSLVEDVSGKALDLVEREIVTLALIASGVLLIFALTLWLCFRMSRAITAPLTSLTDDMLRLAEGQTDLELSGVARSDEIGAMTVAVVSFRDSLIAKHKAEQDLAEAERRAADSRRVLEAEARVAERQLVVESIGLAMGRLAAGDLTFQLSSGLPEDYQKLQRDFNLAVAQLHGAMSAVVTSASMIRMGSGEISQAADDLSRRTEQQAASLEETSAALDEITATVNRTASGTRQVSKTVQTAKTDAETSELVVSDAINAMSAIAKSAREISQIVGAIDEIAFQTNLLALNAGVEAARAGDAGRGFAVVAQEVRALAQRSAEAAKEIKGLISASTTQVNAGVSLVGQTGEALQRIIGRVIEIDGMVSEIAASAQEQATGLHEVNIAINQMDQVTQQNAAMVEQSTAASHSLTQEAETLAGAVSHFQIGTPSAGSATPQASLPPSKPASATVTRLKTVGRGGAARKPEPAAFGDGWESF